MKKRVILFVAVLLVVPFLSSCRDHHSSKEEALYVVRQCKDFEYVVQYFSVRSKSIGWNLDPQLDSSQPDIVANNKAVVHIVIYKIKSGGLKLVLLDDSRPPEIIYQKNLQ